MTQFISYVTAISYVILNALYEKYTGTILNIGRPIQRTKICWLLSYSHSKVVLTRYVNETPFHDNYL